MVIASHRKGMISVYIIIAITIVALVGIYLIFSGKPSSSDKDFQQVFDYYSSCISEETKLALSFAGSQSGHIETDNYIPGSEYAPFSNQLNFLGTSVPYWYYISANGVSKESIPTKDEIENEISNYVSEKLSECDFESFYIQGYSIDIGNPIVKTDILDNKVIMNVENNLVVSKDDKSASKKTYSLEVDSKFGKFYNMAKDIYSKQINEEFLENYTIDVLRLNAPVDGVDLSCSPKIWKTREVIDDIKNGLEANIGHIKFKGDYYTLQNKDNSYFIVDQEVDESVRLLYSKQWSTKINIEGDGVDNELLLAETVGNQEGLGMMGFCYAPYHFVYSISYPVLIQIYDGEELFQFPVAVVIDKNVPRKADSSEFTEEADFDLCEYKNQDVSINLYDTNLNPINANLTFECFSQSCNLGESNQGKFEGKAPACVNGYVKSSLEGYETKRTSFSTNKESNLDIVMDKLFTEKISLEVGGKYFSGNAMIIFNGVNGSKSKSVSLPDLDETTLSEGIYDVSVYAYTNTSVKIPESKKTQCNDVPVSGIGGFFGNTKKECFDITIPETNLEYALIGGGKTPFYFLPEQLQNGNMKISVDEMPTPTTLEQLQDNFASFESREVEINFE